jgi:hypothetical protein
MNDSDAAADTAATMKNAMWKSLSVSGPPWSVVDTYRIPPASATPSAIDSCWNTAAIGVALLVSAVEISA